jgi:hypothetical protein
VDQRLVREHYIDHLSPEACALYLFLVTVADAQGLSYYADRSLRQRLSLSQLALSQARQALMTQGLVAYRRPLYQVLALDPPECVSLTPPQRQVDEVDIKAAFAAIWEVLS